MDVGSYFCTMEKTIPLLDAARFVSGSQEDRIGFAQDLRQAFERYGFITLENHGLDQTLIDRTYSEAERFFALPEDKKREASIPGVGGNFGYTPFGRGVPRTRPGPTSRSSTILPRPTTTSRIARMCRIS